MCKRIKELANLVDKKVIAEIGADHGYITRELFNLKIIKFAYLTDISNKCLEKARKTFEDEFYKDKVSFFIGDGILALKNNIKLKPKQIIIAGMGGNEIINILSKNEDYVNFILQPQKNTKELRIFLNQNKYHIQKDFIVKEGKIFYNILKVKKKTTLQKLSEFDIIFGKSNLEEKNIDFIEFLKFKKNLLEKILKEKNIDEKQKELKEINFLLSKKNLELK